MSSGRCSVSEVSEATAHEVRFLATSPSVPWRLLDQGRASEPPAAGELAVYEFAGTTPPLGTINAQGDPAAATPSDVLVRCDLLLPNIAPEAVFEQVLARSGAPGAFGPITRGVEVIAKPSPLEWIVRIIYAPLCLGGALSALVPLLVCTHTDPAARLFLIAARSIALDAAAAAASEGKCIVLPSGLLLVPGPGGRGTRVSIVQHLKDAPRAYIAIAAFAGLEAGALIDALLPVAEPMHPDVCSLVSDAHEMQLSMTPQNTTWRLVFSERGLAITVRKDDPAVLGLRGAISFDADADTLRSIAVGDEDPFDLLCESKEVLPTQIAGAKLVHRKFGPIISAAGVNEATLLTVTHCSSDGSVHTFYKSFDYDPHSTRDAEFLPSSCAIRRISPTRCLMRWCCVVRHPALENPSPRGPGLATLAAAVIAGLEAMFWAQVSPSRPPAALRERSAALAAIAESINVLPSSGLSGKDGAIGQLSRLTLGTLSQHPRHIMPFDDTAALQASIAVKRPRPSRAVGGSTADSVANVPLFVADPDPAFVILGCGSTEEEIEESLQPPSCAEAAASFAFAALQQPPRPIQASARPLAPGEGSPLQRMPLSVLANVLSFLPRESVAACMRSCSAFYNAATSRDTEAFVWSRVRMRECPWPQTVPQLQERFGLCRSLLLRNAWHAGKYRCTVLAQGHTSSVRSMTFLPQARLMYSGASDRKVKVWALVHDSNSCLVNAATLCGPNAGVVGVDATLQNTLVAGFRNGAARYWVATQSGQWELARELQFSPLADGFLFAHPRAVVWNDAAQVWDEERATILAAFSGHTRRLTSVKLWQPDGFTLLSSSLDKTVRLWDIRDMRTGKESRLTLSGHSAGVNCIDLFNNFMVVTGANDRNIRIWDIRKASDSVATLNGHVSPVKCIRYGAGFIVSGSDDHSMRVWSPQDFQCVQRFEEHTTPITCLELDERFLVSASSDGVIKLWDFLPR